jgi:predicted GNAT family N-acyltransferase
MADSDWPKILFEGPMDLTGYDCNQWSDKQTAKIPIPFLECMLVREEVFTREQGIPLCMEADQDDPRCCHWVAYDRMPGQKMPDVVGAIRLVPFPQSPHPLPGSSWDPDEEIFNIKLEKAATKPWIVDRETTFHDGKEPYLMLGRLAVIKQYRGKGIATKLAKRAIEWAKENPAYFDPPATMKVPGAALDSCRTTWKGLICVHAQEDAARFWMSLGFQVDEKMGKWTEGGISHVGMFKRIKLPKA